MRETGLSSVRVPVEFGVCCASVAASNAALVASVGVMLGAGDTAFALGSVALMEAVLGSLLFSVLCDKNQPMITTCKLMLLKASTKNYFLNKLIIK